MAEVKVPVQVDVGEFLNNIPVRIVLTNPDAHIPYYAKEGDAGADVHSIPNGKKSTSAKGIAAKNQDGNDCLGKERDYLIGPGETVLVDLGLKIELPYGWEMQVRSRSGMAKRGIVVANAPGTIDSGYRGPCMVLLRNNNPEDRIIQAGARIAQFVLKRAPRAEYVEVSSLEESDRGEGGFGSTGS